MRLRLLILLLLLLSPFRVAHGDAPVTIDFTSAAVPPDMRPAIAATLLDLTPPLSSARHLAIVSLQAQGDWALATLTALDGDPEAVGMGDDGALIVLHRNDQGTWQAAPEGTPAFQTLAADAPDSVLPHDAKTALLPDALAPADALDVTMVFPWDRTQSWYYTQGWHYGNYVDFAPSHSLVNKWVLAAHDGVVTRLCLGPLTVNLRVTHSSGAITSYSHLDKTTVPDAILGKTVVQGQLLGKAYNLPFTSTDDFCGYSSGAHLHFGLPSQTVTVDGWTSHPDSTWTRGSDPPKTLYSWFSSSNVLNMGLTPRVFIPFAKR
ncbi:MAG: M23 family metallopeptidase [Chloroflexi bacterium]|nr:M23 family metallopeptidase [Chloroflexota bacterium]